MFYLSGEHGFDADVAGGKAKPNFLADVKILPGGSKGNYFECADNELWSYWAAGNVYAQRGTLAFDWRSREPLTETEFPIFRVGMGTTRAGMRRGSGSTGMGMDSTRL